MHSYSRIHGPDQLIRSGEDNGREACGVRRVCCSMQSAEHTAVIENAKTVYIDRSLTTRLSKWVRLHRVCFSDIYLHKIQIAEYEAKHICLQMYRCVHGAN